MNRSILLLLLAVLSWLIGCPARAQDTLRAHNKKHRWGILTEWINYRSFSQQKMDFPMKAGYPVLQSRSPAFGAWYRLFSSKAHHKISLKATVPRQLLSNDGRGNNYLLQESGFSYFRLGLDYHLTYPLVEWKGLIVRHGLTSGLLYENRDLMYFSGAREQTADINLYLGPGFYANYQLNSRLALKGRFDGRFYLPWVNYGRLRAWDAQGETVFSHTYRGFYYQALFRVGVSYRLEREGIVEAGVMKSDLVGFANRKPAFQVDEMVHHKLDRLLHFYFSYRF